MKSLPREDRKRIGEDIKTVEFGWPIGMPVCRSLGQGLYEVRSSLTKGRIARVLFYIDKKGRIYFSDPRYLGDEPQASACLLGYTVGNDISARDAGKQLGSLDLFMDLR